MAACAGSAARHAAQKAPAGLNVHTTREKELIEPLLRVFEGLTRVKLNVVYLTGDPMARLKADAGAGKADLFIAAELSQLIAAKSAGLTEPVEQRRSRGARAGELSRSRTGIGSA